MLMLTISMAPAAAWVSLSVLLFPVGSAAALILLHGFLGDSREPATANHG